MPFIFHVTCGNDIGPANICDLGMFASFEGAMAAVDTGVAKLGAPVEVSYVNYNEWEWVVPEHERFFRILRREIKP